MFQYEFSIPTEWQTKIKSDTSALFVLERRLKAWMKQQGIDITDGPAITSEKILFSSAQDPNPVLATFIPNTLSPDEQTEQTNFQNMRAIFDRIRNNTATNDDRNKTILWLAKQIRSDI
jgi:hypothetical protein